MPMNSRQQQKNDCKGKTKLYLCCIKNLHERYNKCIASCSW